jgi:pyrroline-5-carboxylate reductase
VKGKKTGTNKIAFLGAGNMAEAIMKGVLDAALFRPDELIASDISSERLAAVGQQYKIQTTLSNREAVQEGDIIILGVKPLVVDSVLSEIAPLLAKKLLISVAAGIPLRRLMAHLNSETAVIRAMPNAAARVLAGATVLSPGSYVDPLQLDQAVAVFNSIGKTWILDERLQDAVTGLSGSGPAFVMVVIEAMAEGGVKCGLEYDVAMALSAQTVFGASLWLKTSGEHPARLKDLVASPSGTTIAGLHQLEAHGLRAALISGVEAATQRSKALGREEKA